MPSSDADAVLRALAIFAKAGVGDVKKLRGYEAPTWRIRVGRWRAFYCREGTGVVVHRILDRKDAYRV